jgi:DNA replication initiation complex subunit (GINS family)
MINIIIDIYNFLVDLYQNIPGIPEGVTYAIFGIKKKKKKAKRELAKLDNIPGIEGPQVSDGPNVTTEGTEFVTDSNVIPGTDTPEVPYIPSFPYEGAQIILNSDRLHLNAKNDFILLNSKKSISLAAPGSINVDTEGTFIVNANKIRLGIGEQANHPLVKGDKLQELFISCATFFQKVAEAIEEAEDSIGGKQADQKIASKNLSQLSKTILTVLPDIVSNQNFTK